MFHYTYILESRLHGKKYVGFSRDLRRRLIEHNAGRVNATRTGRPWRLIYYEACLVEAKAVARERYFKTGFGRRFLRDRIGNLTRA